jgi:predicted transcriptional regulator
MREQGRTLREIAAEVGVGHETVRAVLGDFDAGRTGRRRRSPVLPDDQFL